MIALAAGFASGTTQAQTTTQDFELGPEGSGTAIPAVSVVTPAWIPAGTLPVGSILRSVSINARIDTDGGSQTFANDLFVYFDAGVAGTDGDGEVLQVGGFDTLDSPTTFVQWTDGGNGTVGTTVVETQSAPTAFPDTIDLNTVNIHIGSRGLDPATWSGTVTIEYDQFVPATILSFGPGAEIGELTGNTAAITWTVPFGTDVTALAPTFTLSSGTCNRDNGGPATYDFTNPVDYTVTDGGDVNVYTVTVVEANSLVWNVAGGGDWDFATANWDPQPSGPATTFTNGNEVSFDNSAGGTINIVDPVAPLVTTVNASSGTYKVAGQPITTGSLTKDGGGALWLEDTNTYDGGTTINGGTLRTGLQKDDALGTGPVTLNDGTIFLWRGDHPNPLTVNGGKILAENGFNDSGWSGPVILNADLTVQQNWRMTFSGVISGNGGLSITGGNIVRMTGASGANTYTGPTSVTNGTLQCDTADSLGGGDLSISSGAAKVNLNFTGTKAIDSLTLGGTLQTADGSYGSALSDATFKSSFFDGTGTVTIGDPDKAAFITSFGATLAGSSAIINPVTSNTATIEWIVPAGSELSTLAPEFVISPGATCSDQTSGATPSPGFDAGPVTYTVVSQDTTVTNVYTVSVTVLIPESVLTWNIPGSGDWDTITPNWLGQTSGLPTTFVSDDSQEVIFDNPAGGTIDITSDMSPMAITASAASGNYTFIGGPLAGSGTLTKSGGGTLTFGVGNQTAHTNTYSGGTVIDGGTLRANHPSVTPFGSGPVTLNDGQLYLWRVTVANELIINGGNIYASNGFGNNWNGPITLNADMVINNHFNFTATNTVSGVGGITKSGGNKTIFSGTNTYTGATTVTAGTLQCNSPDSLGGGDLIVDGGKVNLNYTGTKTIASLTLGGTVQTATGTYGSVASGADFQDDAYFEGNGTVTIGGDTPFDSWAAGPFNGTLANTDASLDFDLGSLPTGIEWVVGGDPTNPADDAGLAPTGAIDETGTYLVVTYQRTDAANDDGNTTIKVEYDTDLQGTWTEAQDGTDNVVVEVTDGSPADTVVVKIPLSLAAPGSTLFARLNVEVATPE